ncbi:hypothetical protein HUU53_02850 [Candidatus Micrarchaeota archaeon]|nr:hypothetical protein [Candidatus Micrarchaeota archaeon]
MKFLLFVFSLFFVSFSSGIVWGGPNNEVAYCLCYPVFARCIGPVAQECYATKACFTNIPSEEDKQAWSDQKKDKYGCNNCDYGVGEDPIDGYWTPCPADSLVNENLYPEDDPGYCSIRFKLVERNGVLEKDYFCGGNRDCDGSLATCQRDRDSTDETWKGGDPYSCSCQATKELKPAQDGCAYKQVNNLDGETEWICDGSCSQVDRSCQIRADKSCGCARDPVEDWSDLYSVSEPVKPAPVQASDWMIAGLGFAGVIGLIYFFGLTKKK